jgi:hypothetical protein
MGFAVLEAVKRFAERQVSRYIERTEIKPFHQIDAGTCSRLQLFDELIDIMLDYGTLRLQRLLRESIRQYSPKARMVVFFRAHNGARIFRHFLLKPYPISLEGQVPWSIAVDVLPGSRVCEAQLIRRNPDNIAISIMDCFHLKMEVSTMK